LAKAFDLPLRKSEEIVDTVFNTMSRKLAGGDRIEIRGFGAFVVKEYRGYTGRNPKTGEKTVVGQKKLPFFKAGKDLRKKLNQK
jgi:integration host factor subunit beta